MILGFIALIGIICHALYKAGMKLADEERQDLADRINAGRE